MAGKIRHFSMSSKRKSRRGAWSCCEKVGHDLVLHLEAADHLCSLVFPDSLCAELGHLRLFASRDSARGEDEAPARCAFSFFSAHFSRFGCSPRRISIVCAKLLIV